MTSKTTKRALFSSVLALVLCFTMLLGSTFAWFTDSATSSNNKIQSGTLKVDLEVLEEDNTTWTSVKANKDPIFTYDKWEPGFTQVKILRVVNEGTLALKWKAQLVSSAPVGELAKVIDVYVKEDVTSYPTDRTDLDGWTKLPGTLADFVANIETTTTGEIKAAVGTEPACEVLGIAFKMQESAGNEYQDKTLGAFDINILATQNTVEDDSFNNQYDAQAQYPVLASTPAALNDALENAQPGQTIVLSENVDYGTVTLGDVSDVTIVGAEGASATIKTDANSVIENVTLQEMNFEYTGASVDFALVINENAQIENLVIENSSFTGTGAKAGRGLSGKNNTASIVLKNCSFTDLGYPIYAWGGYEALVVENCTFTNIKSWAIMPQSGFDGDLTVTGCKFIDCLGGGLIKAGKLTAGHTFTFTDNEINGCTIAGDHNWFQFDTSAGTTVISGNTKDGVAWTPTVADGLK